jgi:Methyltransferase domain
VTSADLLAEESADVVISNHCLEPTLNSLEEVRQLHRVLSPGGTIPRLVEQMTVLVALLIRRREIRAMARRSD